MTKINIQAPWEVNDYLSQVIQSKVEKLAAKGDHILHADVFLKMGAHAGVEDKLVEIRLRVPGPELYAEAYAETHEKAVAAACEKLRRQLIRKKEKQSNR